MAVSRFFELKKQGGYSTEQALTPPLCVGAKILALTGAAVSVHVAPVVATLDVGVSHKGRSPVLLTTWSAAFDSSSFAFQVG